jgi:hypothetical protein
MAPEHPDREMTRKPPAEDLRDRAAVLHFATASSASNVVGQAVGV